LFEQKSKCTTQCITQIQPYIDVLNGKKRNKRLI